MKAIIVSLLCLLSLVTSASAECAWVLWMQVGQDPVTANGAYETKQVCQDAVRKAFADLKRLLPDTELLEGLAGQIVRDTKGGITTVYRCLPDTIDPRGPKGGAR